MRSRSPDCGADERGGRRDPDGVEVRQQARLGGGAVLEVDEHPVVAGPAADLRGQRRAQVEEGAEEGLAGQGAGTDVGHRPMMRDCRRAGGGYGPLTSPRGVHDLEVRALDDVELVQHVVIEPRVAGAGHVPGRAVVGEDHPVVLERLGDDPRLRGEAGGVVGRLEPHAQAHRRQAERARFAGLVARRVDVRRARPVGREAEGVGDLAGGDLVVADEARAGSAGRRRRRSCSRRAAARSRRGPDRAAAGLPGAPRPCARRTARRARTRPCRPGGCGRRRPRRPPGAGWPGSGTGRGRSPRRSRR